MGYLLVALIAFFLGFVIGLRSKAQAKLKSRNKDKEITKFNLSSKLRNPLMNRAYKEQLEPNNLPNISAPPPPPPSRVIKEGEAPVPPKKKVKHVQPGIMYNKDTFTSVNKCQSCGTLGHEYDMFRSNPCPRCGGTVQRHGAAKWDGEHWEMSKA